MDKTLLKGIKVLEALVDLDGQDLTIDALAARLGLTRSNTHRTLQTLIHAGYIIRSPEGGYRSSTRFFEMGARVLARLDVRQAAAPFMRTLAQETEETVHLSILEGAEIIYIDKIDSPKPVRSYSMLGGRAPAHAVATGKALLAYQAEGYVERYLAQPTRYTPSTITTLLALKETLAEVVRTGYAINRGEWRSTVGGLAAAVFNGLSARPVAALGISGPLDRLDKAKMQQCRDIVLNCVGELSRTMGYKRPQENASPSATTTPSTAVATA